MRWAVFKDACYPLIKVLDSGRHPHAQGSLISPIGFLGNPLTPRQFMAWERSFESRVTRVRDKELSYQWRNYVIEVCSQLSAKLVG